MKVSINSAMAFLRYASFAALRPFIKISRGLFQLFSAWKIVSSFSSCFDANGGVFEALLGEQDAIISDELNHASIIDGIRLCKAARYRYKNRDLADLEAKLKEAKKHRFCLIVTDGVFSMDGSIAPLKEILQPR